MYDGKGDRSREAFRGCLLGGAVGDALGAPVEFLDLAELRRRHGADGVEGLVAGDWPAGTITDDTQLSLFTAEAMIRAERRREREELVSIPGAARRAYLRWLHTQGEHVAHETMDGWLVTVRGLHARRAPGSTCLAALRDGGWGSRRAPTNDSKGNGGVMRVAPVGLARPERAFEAGCEVAAITHGHPTGQLAAGYLAQVVADVSRGAVLLEAAERGLGRLGTERGHEETTAAVERAIGLAGEAARGLAPTAGVVESLGGGWVAEEALAIGLYCALVARDFAHGVLLAVNHGGDSDSTGAIAGNLLGLVCGERGLPAGWLARLELRDVVTQVADDLWNHFGDGRPESCDDVDRYPPA
jgi:ADP-ribosylglycohydrolase